MSQDSSKDKILGEGGGTSTDQKQHDQGTTVRKLKINKHESLDTRSPIRPQPREIQNHAQSLSQVDEHVIEPQTQQVTRLEQGNSAGKMRKRPDKAKFEKQKKDTPIEEKKEQQWAQGSSKVGWWMVSSGAALVLILVSAVVLSSYLEKNTMEQVGSPELETATTDPFAGSPERWFRKQGGEVVKQATQLLKEYTEAASIEDKADFVRDREGFLSKFQDWPVKVNPRLDHTDMNGWEADHTGETAFLILKTENQNFLPMRLYFVRQGEQLKLDWEASTAWAPHTFPDLKKRLAQKEYSSTGDRSYLLRGLLRRRNEFYAGPYNDEEHAAFMISSYDQEHYFWGYTKRDSALDIELRKLLDHGSFVVDLKKDIPVTLRVKKGQKDALPSQLELMEFVFPEWVKP